jgi:anti-anti-sigma regulatory factor
LWVIYVDWSAPIADVREIDLLGDQELRLHGIVKSLLPPELGIWRVFCKHKGQWHKAPDFEQWIEIMPRQWQVIILALSPLTRFDVNAMMNLAAATRKLHEQERRLVLAGVTPVQYRSIAESEAARVIDRDNLCPDLEFAIARGIDLVRARQEAARAGPA